jgi:uncharacterized membrane protein YhiD involved in acid resistance
VWVAAVLGIACGVPEFAVGLVGTAFAFAVFVLGRPIERGVMKLLHKEAEENIENKKNQKIIDTQNK